MRRHPNWGLEGRKSVWSRDCIGRCGGGRAILQQADFVLVEREPEGEGETVAGIVDEIDFAAVLADDAPHDEQAQAGSAGFGGEIGFKHLADIFRGNPAAGVGENDAQEGLVEVGSDPEDAPGFHGLKRVSDDVVEGLLELVPVNQEEGRSARNWVSTRMLRSSISGLRNATDSWRRELTFSREGWRWLGRIAPKNCRTVESSRSISSRAISRDFLSSSRVGDWTLRSLRSMSWRWMCRELSGLPIS